MFYLILVSVLVGYNMGQLSTINESREQIMSLAKKKVRLIIAAVSLIIIGFFIFKAFEKSMSEAEASETIY